MQKPKRNISEIHAQICELERKSLNFSPQDDLKGMLRQLNAIQQRIFQELERRNKRQETM